MSEHSMQHPSSDELLRFASGESTEDVGQHLRVCEECRDAVFENEEHWTEYVLLHEYVLKPGLPDPAAAFDQFGLHDRNLSGGTEYGSIPQTSDPCEPKKLPRFHKWTQAQESGLAPGRPGRVL